MRSESLHWRHEYLLAPRWSRDHDRRRFVSAKGAGPGVGDTQGSSKRARASSRCSSSSNSMRARRRSQDERTRGEPTLLLEDPAGPLPSGDEAHPAGLCA